MKAVTALFETQTVVEIREVWHCRLNLLIPLCTKEDMHWTMLYEFLWQRLAPVQDPTGVRLIFIVTIEAALNTDSHTLHAFMRDAKSKENQQGS